MFCLVWFEDSKYLKLWSYNKERQKNTHSGPCVFLRECTAHSAEKKRKKKKEAESSSESDSDDDKKKKKRKKKKKEKKQKHKKTERSVVPQQC